jgi:hypothetical protein
MKKEDPFKFRFFGVDKETSGSALRAYAAPMALQSTLEIKGAGSKHYDQQ